jgi:NAD(P)-dependent dehydrogenase (short-subunit alcohol dehydrogenase family)
MSDHTTPGRSPDEAPVSAVFGGSRGLGLLVARELLARGHRVVVLARDQEELDDAAEKLRDLEPGCGVVTMVCDVSDRHSVGEAVGRIEREVGALHTVLAVAGVIQAGPLEATTLDDYTHAVGTMTLGPVHVALTALPHLRRRSRGHIGIITSIGGEVSPPHLLPYATAKFGAVGFSDGLVSALQGTGVTATTVVPGLMRTGSHVMAEFVGQPEKEYSWFAPGASLPGISIDAERAAKRIVDGVLAGRARVTLTPLAWLAVRARGLAPGTTARIVGLVDSVLPGPGGGRRAWGGDVEGRGFLRLVRPLTVLGDRARHRTNEPRPPA